MPQLQVTPDQGVIKPVFGQLEIENTSPIESLIKLVDRANFNNLVRKDNMADKRKTAYLEKSGGSWVGIKNFEKVQKKLRANDLKTTRRMKECIF